MRRNLLLLSPLLLAACAGQGNMGDRQSESAGLAEELAGRSESAPVDCITTNDSANLVAVDARTLTYRSGPTLYVNRLGAACPGLEPNDTLIVRRFGGQLCRLDTIEPRDWGLDGLPGPRCPLGSFTPYKRALTAGGMRAAGQGTGGVIRTGIGGWTYEPWRGVFYPEGLRQADELGYAAAQLGSIEINGTYYRLQKRESFAKWRDAARQGFVFSVKASRYCTNRKVLAEAGESVEKFFDSGIGELGEKLGPVLWQFAPTKRFEEADFAAFLDLLPSKCEGVTLRHALEVRHASFACAEFVALARDRGAAIVVADHDDYPQIADLTADFVYARLMRSREKIETGYLAGELDEWARIAASWSEGHAPEGLDYVAAKEPTATARDVFAYVISGAKLRAPAAAMSLAERI